MLGFFFSLFFAKVAFIGNLGNNFKATKKRINPSYNPTYK